MKRVNNNIERDYSQEELFLKAEKKVKELKGFYTHLFLYIIIILIWAVVLLVVKDVPSYSQYGLFGMGYGILATVVFWGIGIFFHWLGVFGKNISFSKDWENRKIQEFLDKDE